MGKAAKMFQLAPSVKDEKLEETPTIFKAANFQEEKEFNTPKKEENSPEVATKSMTAATGNTACSFGPKASSAKNMQVQVQEFAGVKVAEK